MILPLSVSNRDPTNPQHVREALKIINHLQGGYLLTEQTDKDLRAVGIHPRKKQLVRKQDADAVVGGFFRLEQGVNFPDAVIVTCETCRIPLEIRPHMCDVTHKLCVFCAADRLLLKHRQQQSGTPDAGIAKASRPHGRRIKDVAKVN